LRDSNSVRALKPEDGKESAFEIQIKTTQLGEEKN
jgi:hypothetical protein